MTTDPSLAQGCPRPILPHSIPNPQPCPEGQETQVLARMQASRSRKTSLRWLRALLAHSVPFL